MNFTEYCIATKNYSALNAVSEYTKSFGKYKDLPDGTSIIDTDNDQFATVKNGIIYHKSPNKTKKLIEENYRENTGDNKATYEDWKKVFKREQNNHRIKQQLKAIKNGEKVPESLYKYGKKMNK